MKMKKLAFMAAIALAFGVLAGLPSAAQALTIGDAFDLGNVTPPEPANPVAEEHYVNTLISHAAGTFTDVYGNPPVTFTYNRTAASCGTCPAAVFNHKDETGSNQVDLGTGGYTYLLAKYDGPHGVSEVWNVQGMTGIVEIPSSLGVGLGLSHWTLFGPGGQVPDGGTTVMLLGAALGALGMVRRYLSS